MTDDIVLDETIHQSTRLRIMTMLVSMPEPDRLAYGFIQKTLDLTGGNLTTHLRKLEDADFSGHHQGVPGLQAAHLDTGDADGTPRLRRVPHQPGEGAELAAADVATPRKLTLRNPDL